MDAAMKQKVLRAGVSEGFFARVSRTKIAPRQEEHHDADQKKLRQPRRCQRPTDSQVACCSIAKM